MSKQNVYEANGFENRNEYLRDLADQYDIPFDMVQELAEVLGPTEDFDGLVNELQDAADMYADLFDIDTF